MSKVAITQLCSYICENLTQISIKKLNNVFHNKLNSIEGTSDLLICQMYKLLLLSYGARALKICPDTGHPKVGEQHI